MMIEYFFIAVLGAALGSFLNVLILRAREGMTILGRSQCPHCYIKLRPQHLVPIISWLLLRGRCAACRRPIHIQYPLVELSSAVLLILAYIHHPFFSQSEIWPLFMLESVLLLGLLAFAVFDLRWKLLPIEPIIILSVLAVIGNVALSQLTWTSVLLGMMITGLFLGFQVLISHGRWMGEGDPWLGILMGAWLGWPHVGIALYLTYVLGGLGIGLLWLLGIVKRGTRIPFAPLLALGTLGVLIFGETLEGWARLLLV